MKITSDAMKFEPYRMCPSAFNTTFWQFFDFIFQISHNKPLKSGILGVGTQSFKNMRAGFLRECQISLSQTSPKMRHEKK